MSILFELIFTTNYELDQIVVFILQMDRLGLRAVKWCDQSTKVGGWELTQSWSS